MFNIHYKKVTIEMCIIWNYCVIAEKMIKKVCIKSGKYHKCLVFKIKHHVVIMHVVTQLSCKYAHV